MALSLDEELPVVNVGKEFNSESDACSTLSKNKLDDTIALMYQGGCNLVEKLKNAKEAGAKAALVYTNTVNATTSFVSITNNNILPVAFINNDDGKTIFDLSKTSNMVMGQFTNTLVAMDAPASNIDAIGDFSTLGPTNELQLKPELVAVGGNVFSTLPTYLKSYGFESGTSFSTPVISGAVALLLSELDEKPKPEQVKELLMNFAKPGKA